MSVTNLPDQLTIEERDEEVVDCPPGIQEQLQQAAFVQGEKTNVYVKTREPIEGGDRRKVVEAEINGDQLHISVNDIVGVVTLTPNSRLNIR
jgi:hypothetical protein